MSTAFRLDYVIERVLAESYPDERRLLKQAAGVKLPRGEARRLWPRVEEHKWYLSERLGRDVGLRVAAVDFFENVHIVHADFATRRRADTLPPRLPMMQPLSG